MTTQPQMQPREASYESTKPFEQGPLNAAACEAYDPKSREIIKPYSSGSTNEKMADEDLDKFFKDSFQNNSELYSTTKTANSLAETNHGHGINTDNQSPGQEKLNEHHGRHHHQGNSEAHGDDRNRDRTEILKDHDSDCQSGDNTNMQPPADSQQGCDRIIIEPGKDSPRPPLGAGEFLVVMINVSSEQMSKAGDFISRLLGSANGFHLDGVPNPSDFISNLPGAHLLPGSGGVNSGVDAFLDSLPRPGHGLPSLGNIGLNFGFNSGDNQDNDSFLDGLFPGGLDNMFGGGLLPGLSGGGDDGRSSDQDSWSIRQRSGRDCGRGGGNLSGIPGGDLLSSLTGRVSLPGMGGNGLSDALNALPGIPDLPKLPGMDGKIPMPHEVIEDAVTKPIKTIKNLFKKIF